MSPAAPCIGVIGSGDASAELAAAAEAVGAGLARGGAVVVCGGLGGVMEAACRGARGAGGTTVGLLPGRDRAAANPWVTVAIATGLGEARNGVVACASDVLVAVGGEFGTLSEIGFGLKLGRPVVGLGTWELARGGASSDAIVRAADPDDAVALALALAAAAA